MICEECKNQLVDFYAFREGARRNSRLVADEIVDEVLEFIDENKYDSLNVTRHHNCLSIVPDSQYANFEIVMQSVLESTVEELQSETVMQSEADVHFTEDQDDDVVMALEYPDDDDCWIAQEVDETTELIQEEENSTSDDWTWCKLCSESAFPAKFADSKSYKMHMKEFHQLSEHDGILDRDIKSEITIEPHIRVAKLKRSYTTSSPESKQNRLYCAECGYKFKLVSHFRAHKNGHKLFDVVAKVTEFPVCEECQYMFCDEESLGLHESSDHDRVPMDGNFLKIGTLRDGFLPPEVVDSVIKCGHCIQEFESVTACRVHQYLYHVGLPKCPFENRDFINNQAFSVHLKNNHPEIFDDENIFKCKTCDENFENLYDKLRHMKTCDKMKFKCHHCDKKFRLRCLLKAHLDQVNGVTAIICMLCNKTFPNKNDLGIHMRSHSNDKPFKCSMCPKAYKTSSARASHQETHNENGFTCEVCKSKFKARRIMLKHFRDKHRHNL